MLPCQRALFDIPRDVCYLNAAGWSPLPLATMAAAREAVARKGQPWLIDNAFAIAQHERARKAAASLIHASPSDVALVSSISYAAATVAKMVEIPKGARVLVMQDDHSSPALEWLGRAERQGFTAETVNRPADLDWTAAFLEAIERPGAAPIALASISNVNWSDGCIVDMAQIGAALRKQGALLLIDATHGTGVLDLDVTALDPDFVAFPTYKWLLGPYGRAFLYVAKRHQDGIPLEQTSAARRGVKAEQAVYFEDTRYVSDARRFDMGERDHFISLEMAAMGMELMASWGTTAVSQRLAMLTDRLAEGLSGLAVAIAPRRVRTPHVLGVAFPGGMPADLAARLAEQKVFAAPRLGRLRLSPHVYNDEADIDRCVAVMRSLLSKRS
jgi:selenocysteine lyase/cysteine desulfurase